MTVLDIFALVVLLVIAAVFVGGAVLLAMWPGRVARERGHPRADAVAICGWWGLVTMGLLLPIAWIWAYSWPPGGFSEASEAEGKREGDDA